MDAALVDVSVKIILTLTAAFFMRSRRILQGGSSKAFSSFVYYAALPSLFLVKTASIDLSLFSAEFTALVLLPPFSMIALLFVLKTLKLLNRRVFVLASLAFIFGSHAFFAYPYFSSLYGTDGREYAVLLSSLTGVVGVFGTQILILYGSRQRAGFLSVIKKTFLNPPVLAVMSGIVVNLSGFSLGVLTPFFNFLSRTTAPLALFALGLFIYDHFSVKILKAALPFAILRIFLLPAVFLFWLSVLKDKTPYPQVFFLMTSGMPAAVSLAVFAERYGYEKKVITGIVVTTSCAALFVLGLFHNFAGYFF